MIKLHLIFLLLQLTNGSITSVIAQSQKNEFKSPLDIPLTISGNFGEFRSSHFHTGLDFKTLGITGLNVFCSANGYIARIKIESGGFGRSIYIIHPNGSTSVYGHLEGFRNDVDSFCKKLQYEKKSFPIDIFPKPHQFELKKGEWFATSGNAGGSGGPHLHFELRDANAQHPVNPMRYFLAQVKDTIPPTIFSICIYSLDENSLVKSSPVQYKISNSISPTIYASGLIAIGVDCIDFTNESISKTGVYKTLLFANNKLIYEQVFDKLSFTESKFVNAVTDYEQYISTKKRINKLFSVQNSHVSNQIFVCKNGILNISDTTILNLKIEAIDDHQNKSSFSFQIKGSQNKQSDISLTGSLDYLTWAKDNRINKDSLLVYIPQKALFSDMAFQYNKENNRNYVYSALYSISTLYVPLCTNIQISIKPNHIQKTLTSKLLLKRVDTDGSLQWTGGRYENGLVTAWTRSFGQYTVGIDTIAPTIEPTFNNPNKTNFSKWRYISFIIKDEMSGIANYSGMIDGKWALFEYDSKTNSISMDLKDFGLKLGHKHQLSIKVYDNKGNATKYSCSFYK